LSSEGRTGMLGGKGGRRSWGVKDPVEKEIPKLSQQAES